MKRYSLIFLLIICKMDMQAQGQYEISTAKRHNQQKVLKGMINKYLVSNDTSFSWFAANQRYFTPDTSTLNTLEKVKSTKVQFVVFGGTWCEDTQFILPKFFKLQEMTGITDEQVTFFGVDEDKKSMGHIAEAFGITNVPTIIVMKEGKELGRVVEYGKSGKWDKDLADILNQSK